MNKIEFSRGCMSWGVDCDGKSLSDMNYDEAKAVFDNIINYLIAKEGMTYYHFIEALVETHGEYESLGYCEQCGDTVEKFTLNIE